MSEQQSTPPAYVQRLFDYFLSRPEDEERRAEYVRRGLVPTNNLCLLIVDAPNTELVPGTGVANPYDYRQKPYGQIIESLKVTHPELWERAKNTTTAHAQASSAYWEAISTEGTSSPKAQEIGAQSEALEWESAEVHTDIIRIISPQLEAIGVDPLDLCK